MQKPLGFRNNYYSVLLQEGLSPTQGRPISIQETTSWKVKHCWGTQEINCILCSSKVREWVRNSMPVDTTRNRPNPIKISHSIYFRFSSVYPPVNDWSSKWL